MYDYTVTLPIIWHPFLGWLLPALGILLAAKIALRLL